MDGADAGATGLTFMLVIVPLKAVERYDLQRTCMFEARVGRNFWYVSGHTVPIAVLSNVVRVDTIVKLPLANPIFLVHISKVQDSYVCLNCLIQ